ncbi:unnamed protein product, partial [Coregonus sp. 'balchen']
MWTQRWGCRLGLRMGSWRVPWLGLEAEQWLGSYTKGPAPVIRAIKKVVVSGRELPLEAALRTERDVFGTVWGGPANLQALASKAKQSNTRVTVTEPQGDRTQNPRVTEHQGDTDRTP